MNSERSVARHPVWLPRVGVAALALVAALAASLAASGLPDAEAVKATVLGETKDVPDPACPKADCEAIGSVTGFQVGADGEKALFRIRKEGHLVAWSVRTSRPNAEQRKFFGDFYPDPEFGKVPAARIAVLRREEGSKLKFELRKQSPAVTLAKDLGTSPVITLAKPLKVKQGDIVGLTVPTWLSAFAINLRRSDAWRGSRSSRRCVGENDLEASEPHQKVGSVRKYGCRYTTARLLYWAYFVPERAGGGGPDEN